MAKKRVGSKILVLKNIRRKIILGPKKLWLQETYVSKNFWVERNYGTKKFLGLKTFEVQNNLSPRIFWFKLILGPKSSLVEKEI